MNPKYGISVVVPQTFFHSEIRGSIVIVHRFLRLVLVLLVFQATCTVVT